MNNEEQYTLTYEYGDIGVTMNIGQGLNVDEMVEQFENFLFATGYRLPEGMKIGIMSDEPEAPKVDRYLGGLFDDESGSPFKFDGNHTGWLSDSESVTVLGDK